VCIACHVWLTGCFGGKGGGGGGGHGGGGDGGVGGAPGGTVTIIEPAVAYPQVVARSKLDFQAKVQNSNGMGVNWGVQLGDTCTTTGSSNLGTLGGDSTVGTMLSNTPDTKLATYTAPSTPPPDNVPVTITALQPPETTGPCVVVFIVANNNALFNFNFIFRLRGFSSPSGLTYAVIGRFNADGNGGINSGLEDVNIAQPDGSSAAFTKVAFTGSYNMDSSSHGTATLTVTSPPWGATPPRNPPPSTMHLSFTLSLDGSFGSLIETDGAATPVAYVGSGDFQFQGNSARFNTTNIVGSYVVSLAGPAGSGTTAVHKGLIGRLDLQASTPTTGTIATTSTLDNESGGGPTHTPSGSTYTIDDQSNGHGAFNIVGSANPTLSFYIGGPGRMFTLRTDNLSGSPAAILLGIARFSPRAAFDNNSVFGSVVFQMLGINASGHASALVGTLVSGPTINSTTNGNLAGILDLNDGGAVPASLPVSFMGPGGPNPATFTVAPNGRGTVSVSIATSSGTVTYNFVFYARSSGQGFLLEQPASDRSNRGRSGYFFPPDVTSGGNGTFIGSTTVATAASTNALAVLPFVASKNSGSFQNGTGYTSVLGSPAASSSISGTFTVTDPTSNRGTVTASSGSIAGSGTGAFYEVTSAEVIVVGTDPANLEPQIISFDQ